MGLVSHAWLLDQSPARVVELRERSAHVTNFVEADVLHRSVAYELKDQSDPVFFVIKIKRRHHSEKIGKLKCLLRHERTQFTSQTAFRN